MCLYALVAKLVYASDSKSDEFALIWVRVPSGARSAFFLGFLVPLVSKETLGSQFKPVSKYEN